MGSTEIDTLIEAEFEKLVPFKPLTGPEKAAIKLAFARYLEQKKQYYEQQKECGADYWLYTHRQRVVDDLLKELER